MGNRKDESFKRHFRPPPSKAKHAMTPPTQPQAPLPIAKQVPSLLDAMEDGNEYASIVSLVPTVDLVVELRRALGEIEAVRGRPCVCYIGNVVRPSVASSINDGDDLPFNEMLSRVPHDAKNIDVLVATNGGSGQQVSQFVDTLRSRFDSVEYLLPYKCMSAGTLWVCSGDRVWMDDRAFLGPIDPQVPTQDGSYVPAQSLVILMKNIQKQGDALLKNGKQLPWTLVRMLDNIDARKLGDAITLTNYATQMAADFLERYKFKTWIKHTSTGADVTDAERKTRAKEVAGLLASNEHWKSHGHGISREVLKSQVRIHVDCVETVDGLERAIRRFWALVYYVFDRSNSAKVFLSQNYCVIRNNVGR